MELVNSKQEMNRMEEAMEVEDENPFRQQLDEPVEADFPEEPSPAPIEQRMEEKL